MKPTSIVILSIVAVGIFIIILNIGGSSTYVTFSEAEDLSKGGKKASIHVVGTLTKNESGEITGILPSASQMEFSFLLVDNDGRKEKVFYPKPMPADFMSSEQVVVIGGYREEAGEKYFLAEEILLKCPSKYEETELASNG